MTSTGRQSGSGLPTVSVLMPALNATETIEAAIDSVFSDETVAAEVLVIDDGSTDGTIELIEGLDDPRVRLLFTGGERLGANAGRNVGLDAAQGEWVAFLDPDDTWLPGRMSTLLDVAEETDAGWVADDILVVYTDAEGQVTHTTTLFAQRGLEVVGTRPLTLKDLINYDLGVLQPMIRRSLLEEPKIRFPKPATSDFLFSFWSLEAAGGGVVVRLLPPGRLRADRVPWMIPRSCARAECTSPAWAGRRAGSLASMRAVSASISAGSSGRSSRNSGGSSKSTWASRAIG